MSACNCKEEWKPVLGFEGFYEISSRGRVRSMRRVIPHPLTGTLTRPGGMMSPCPNTSNYLFVYLSRGGKRVAGVIHRLVAGAFIGRIPDNMQVNHKDGCRQNNCKCNLEIITQDQNMKHAAHVLNSISHGEGHSKAVLNNNKVRRIREMKGCGARTCDIAREFGVAYNTITAVCERRTWARVL